MSDVNKIYLNKFMQHNLNTDEINNHIIQIVNSVNYSLLFVIDFIKKEKYFKDIETSSESVL